MDLVWPVVAAFQGRSGREVCKDWRKAFDVEGELLLKSPVPDGITTVFIRTLRCTTWRRFAKILVDMSNTVPLHCNAERMEINLMTPCHDSLLAWSTVPELYKCTGEFYVVLDAAALNTALQSAPSARMLEFCIQAKGPSSLHITLHTGRITKHSIPILHVERLIMYIVPTLSNYLEVTIPSLVLQERVQAMSNKYRLVYVHFFDNEFNLSIHPASRATDLTLCIEYFHLLRVSNAILAPTVQVLAKKSNGPLVLMWPDAAQVAIRPPILSFENILETLYRS